MYTFNHAAMGMIKHKGLRIGATRRTGASLGYTPWILGWYYIDKFVLIMVSLIYATLYTNELFMILSTMPNA